MANKNTTGYIIQISIEMKSTYSYSHVGLFFIKINKILKTLN